MGRETRSDHYRTRDGNTTDREERPPTIDLLPWRHVARSDIIAALDMRWYTTETGVNAIPDQGDNGNDATQTTTSKQPAESTNNGKPSALFDGTDDFLNVLNATGHSAGDDMTIFCVARVALSVRATLYETGTMAAKNDRGLWLDTRVIGADNVRMRAHDASGSHVIDDAGNSAGTYVFETTHEDTLTSLFIDGVASGTDNTPTVTLLAQDHIAIGGRGTGGNPFDSHFHSFIAIKGVLSSGVRSLIRSDLNTVWGL